MILARRPWPGPCFGPRLPCELRARRYREVNYENPNYNVQLPVFAIHGNHDDPAGDGGLAALDLLSTANLVNYFGRASNVEKIALTPILIQKGSTKLAMYGLGHVRDERLARSFDRKEVTVRQPHVFLVRRSLADRSFAARAQPGG